MSKNRISDRIKRITAALVDTIYREYEADDSGSIEIVRFKRLGEDGSEIDLWQAERNGKHYLLYVEKGSGLKWDVLSKGSSSSVSSAFERFVRNKLNSVEQFGSGVEVVSKKMDSTAKKRLQLFTEPIFGQTTDWEKAEDASEKSEDEIEQDDFAVYLNRQLKNWKGDFAGKKGFNNIMAMSRHAYWPNFVKMVHAAVKSQYGGRIKLYRGVFGNTAEDIIRGGDFPVSRLSSWTTDKGEAKSHAMHWSKKGFWIVAEHSFSSSQIIMAPVHLAEFKLDPDVLWSELKNEDEFIVLSSKKQLPVKVVMKSRKKLKAVSGSSVNTPRTAKMIRSSIRLKRKGSGWYEGKAQTIMEDDDGNEDKITVEIELEQSEYRGKPWVFSIREGMETLISFEDGHFRNKRDALESLKKVIKAGFYAKGGYRYDKV